MKNMLVLILLVLCSSCAVVDSSDFKYLDDENLELKPLLIIGAEQDVEISLPKSLSYQLPDSLFIKPEGLELVYTRAIEIQYEWLWGGPAHEDKGLYVFELSFSKHAGRKLISETSEEKIRAVRRIYEDMDAGKWRDYVLKKMIVDNYESRQGFEWIMDNQPTVKKYHENFRLPISDERELIVWFWYNEDWVKDHPEWYERRKALSRRILDSVVLSGSK